MSIFYYFLLYVIGIYFRNKIEIINMMMKNFVPSRILGRKRKLLNLAFFFLHNLEPMKNLQSCF